MRILLVDPPGKNKGLNTGLGYLSAVLVGKHDVRVLDLNNLKMGLCGEPNPDLADSAIEERMIGAVVDFDPHLLGVSVKTFTAGVSGRLLRLVKARRPGTLTIAGGPHITLEGVRFIRENGIDLGIRGEGESSVLSLCDALEKNEGLEGIEGLISWKNGQPVQHPKAGAIPDLDSLPFPRFDHFSSVIANRGSIPEYPLLTSRGCPYHCSYCSMPEIMGRRWRAHTPSRVIDELLQAQRRYRSTSFTVIDDNFTLDLERVGSICDLLISKSLNLTWNSQNGIRADRMSDDVAAKMRRSGCRHVWIGIESADERVFRAIQKGEKLEDIRRGIRRLQKAGIRVGGFFIVGLPESTRESDLQSVDFVKETGIDGWWFNFVPYPQTAAWNWVQAHGRYLRPLDGALQYGADQIEPVFETTDYPKEQRLKTYVEIHVRMRLFDRLADSSRGRFDTWLRVFKKISPYGMRRRLSFAVFLLSYHARLAFRRLRGGGSSCQGVPKSIGP